MEKKYRKKSNLAGIMVTSFMALFTFSACAQSHQQNQQKVAIFNNISSNTVLLNNDTQLLPLTSLDQKNIAAVSLGFSFQSTLDSLLNKYTKVSSFSADAYMASSTLDELEDDLKYFNLVIVALPVSAMNNPRNTSFINSIQKQKDHYRTIWRNRQPIGI